MLIQGDCLAKVIASPVIFLWLPSISRGMVEGLSTGNKKATLFKSLEPWLGRASKDVLGHAKPEYSDPPSQLGEGQGSSLGLPLVILDSVGPGSQGA